MIKIFLMVAFMSSPPWPSVKTQSYVYADDPTCQQAVADFFNYYESQSDFYKSNVVVDAHCLEFESFMIPGFEPMSYGS
jgi:hypothetical protein